MLPFAVALECLELIARRHGQDRQVRGAPITMLALGAPPLLSDVEAPDFQFALPDAKLRHYMDAT
jgi:hypothetical protein